MALPLTNYHTHTPRCNHADGTEREYVEAAIRSGFEILGFSDHMAWPVEGVAITRVRMRPDELEDYCTTVQTLKKEYADRIHIYLGAECEYFPEKLPWLLEQKERFGMDYLILGVHCPMENGGRMQFENTTTPEEIQLYTDLALAGMETGYFRYLCHPDLPLKGYPVFDKYARTMCEELCRQAIKLDMPLEYNLHGYDLRGQINGMGYTSEEFWRIAAEYGCKAIVGIDAHQLVAISREDVQAAQQRLTDWGLSVFSVLPGLE